MSVTVTTTGTYLDRILANTATELEARRRSTPMRDLERVAASTARPLSLEAALRTDDVAIIAEIKRASPSKGPIAPDADAREIAATYIAGGAAAISVLTDERFFSGSLADLEGVSVLAHAAAPPVPVLRKDFVIDEYQIVEARAAGADAVLLIVAALSDQHLVALLEASRTFEISALVEVHDEAELDRALAAGATLIGINNRDLRSFSVDLATSERLAPEVPAHVTVVGESGIASRADIERLRKAGVRAVLVGESLMRATDRTRAVRDLQP